MKGFHKSCLILLLFGFLFFACAYLSTTKRSIPGRIARFILGSPLAQQDIEDLVDDVRLGNRPQKLRQWADTILSKYRAGTISTNANPEYWSAGTVLVPDSEVPAWLRDLWGKPQFGLSPQVSIRLGDDGSPSFVVYGWYLKGVAISATSAEQINFGWRHTEASPRIYAYAVEK